MINDFFIKKYYKIYDFVLKYFLLHSFIIKMNL